MKCQIQGPLVATDWLEENLGSENLRIFDVSVTLEESTTGFGYLAVSGLSSWKQAHIDGSGFLDVGQELSDQSCDLGFMMPSPNALGKTLEKKGVDETSTIVLYNRGAPMWATRVWWMLRSIGIKNVGVLNGGWDKWLREERPISNASCHYRRGRVISKLNSAMWVGKEEMLKAVKKGKPLTLNALSPAVYSGDKNQYGRPGHLPGSWNVYYADLLDIESGEFKQAAEMKEKFESSGALRASRVITYCGGGISATVLCFALHLCGQDSVGVYDGSMSEWVQNERLPLTLGNAP